MNADTKQGIIEAVSVLRVTSAVLGAFAGVDWDEAMMGDDVQADPVQMAELLRAKVIRDRALEFQEKAMLELEYLLS